MVDEMSEKTKINLGVVFSGAQIVRRELDDATAQKMMDAVERSHGGNNYNQGNASGGGNGNGPTSGSGGRSGKPDPDIYLPGRLSSKFDDKSEGNPPVVDYGSKELNYNRWNMGREITYGSDGSFVVSSLGSHGYISSFDRERTPSDEPSNAKYKKTYTSGATSGHLHVHPDDEFKHLDYYERATKWYDKTSIIGKIIDKGLSKK